MNVICEDEWKNNLDGRAFFDTFYNCAASDHRNKTYMNDVIQSYHHVLDNGRFFDKLETKIRWRILVL